ncbi:glycosyltransferase family 4 protein [Spirosoma soli]|uniref:Glycosyltransferase family 4 protein n=1 Tax=Spirosoma soli TaxID=1770529 RepID=A0ABW5M8L3_9BACT
MATQRVLIYSQTFAPDHSGISIYASDFAFYCAENGYEVDVITGFPFYPQWQKRKEDKGKLFATDKIKNVSVHRGYLYVPHNPSSMQRILHEFSLVFFALINSFRVKRPDVIVVFATPVLLGVLAAFMNMFWRRKLIINVQDFQVEAAYSLGMLKGSLMLKIINALELWSYKKSDYVSSISGSMLDLLRERKKLPENKILFWPNWIHNDDKSFVKPQAGQFREKFGFSKDTRLIGYAGNVGKKQGLDVLLDTASMFASEPDLKFLIIGEGADLERLKEYAATKAIKNVVFMPFLNPKEYLTFLTDVDAVFISQVKVPFDIYFPSKLLGIMSMGQLLIVNADANSELYKTTKKHNLALVGDYGDINTLAKQVNMVLDNDPVIEEYKAEAEKFVAQFGRDVVLSQALEVVSGVPKPKSVETVVAG